MATIEASSLDYWRTFFRCTRCDIFLVIDKAIDVANLDFSDEFYRRRDGIVEKIFTCNLIAQSPDKQVQYENGLGNRGSQNHQKDDDVTVNGSGVPEEKKEMVSNYSYDEAEALTIEIEEQDMTVAEVLRIKEVLTKHDDEYENVLIESLRRLQLMNLSFVTLKSTKIAKALHDLESHSSKQIRCLVHDLLKAWTSVSNEWGKSNASIADNTLDSLTPEKKQESGLTFPFPPLDEEALIATQTSSFELSKFFDGMDEDGTSNNIVALKIDPKINGDVEKKNPRNVKLENSNTTRKQQEQLICVEDKGQKGIQEEVSKQLKPQQTVTKPPMPKKNPKSNPAVTNGNMKAKVQKKPLPAMRNVLNKTNGAPIKPKVDITKRKNVRTGYQQVENAKKQRTVQVLKAQEGPK